MRWMIRAWSVAFCLWAIPSHAVVLDPLAFTSLGTLNAVETISINTDTLQLTGGASYTGMLDPISGAGIFAFDNVMSNYLWRAHKDRRQAVMARGAGLVSFFPLHDPGAGKTIRELKQQQSLGRTVLAIGVTGHGTVVDDKAELHALLETCLEAKLLLLNPFSEEAARRAQSLSHPDISPNRFREELQDTIALIKRFRASGKVIRLKLYSDRPHLRMVILGDYLWLQHYHTGLDVRWMPEYVFQHNLDHHGLYTLFYQYFTKRWENQEIPEYDFQTDELVYRARNGGELRREPFGLGDSSGLMPSDVTSLERSLAAG